VYIADDSIDKYADMKNALVNIFDMVPGDHTIKAKIEGGEWAKEVRI
jgi:hypothetical protein